jgi:hypothetical protein
MKIQNHHEFPEFDHRAAPSRDIGELVAVGPARALSRRLASRKLGNFQMPFLGRITPPLTIAGMLAIDATTNTAVRRSRGAVLYHLFIICANPKPAASEACATRR